VVEDEPRQSRPALRWGSEESCWQDVSPAEKAGADQEATSADWNSSCASRVAGAREGSGCRAFPSCAVSEITRLQSRMRRVPGGAPLPRQAVRVQLLGRRKMNAPASSFYMS